MLDDRATILSLVAVDDPRAIRESDWQRLATIERPGSGLPYSRSFLDQQDGIVHHAYDRFWCDESHMDESWMTTRWLVCEYGLVGVGKGDRFFRDAIQFHFRYHYTKLAIIAHFHRAALLQFKARLAEAVEEYHHLRRDGIDEAVAPFATKLRGIERDLLKFSNVFWLTEISPQIQPQDLFDLFARHLRTRELYQQVKDQVLDASRYITEERQSMQSESDKTSQGIAKRQQTAITYMQLALSAAILVEPLALTVTWWFRGMAADKIFDFTVAFVKLMVLLPILVASPYLASRLNAWIAHVTENGAKGK